MNLQEEYLLRSGLTNHPYVNYTKKFSVIIEPNLTIMRIKWKDCSREPGHFSLTFINPIHDSVNDKHFKYSKEMEIQWDDYHHYIFEWCRSRDAKSVVFGEEEIAIAFLKIFMCCYDSWLAKNMTVKLESLIWSAIKGPQRQDAYHKVVQYLSANHPNIFRIFKYKLFPFIHPYGHWLQPLINS